jgi:hypothetical protein
VSTRPPVDPECLRVCNGSQYALLLVERWIWRQVHGDDLIVALEQSGQH